MTDDSRLTENVRVRLTAGERAELEKVAAGESRSVSAIARRAIRRELELARKRASRKG